MTKLVFYVTEIILVVIITAVVIVIVVIVVFFIIVRERSANAEWFRTRPIRPTMRPHDDEMIV